MQVVKNFLYNLSYQILILILPLLTVPYVSGILGEKGIGDYAFTFANSQYFVLFGMIGITLYGNRQIAYVRDDKEKLKSTFYSVYLVQLITMFISIIIFFTTFVLLNKGEYKYLYLVQGINIIASLIDISWLFMGIEEFKKTVVRNTIVKVLSFLSIFIFVKTFDDLIIYALILALANLLGNLTFWFYIPKMVGVKNIKIESILNHFKSSITLFIPQIAIQVYTILTKTLLGVLSNKVELGFYENSQKIINIAITVATALGPVMMPKISNTVASGDLNKVKYYIKNSFFFMNFISIPISFGLIGIAKEFSPWFYRGKFIGIEYLLMITAIVIMLVSWSNVFGVQLLIPLNKTKEFTTSVTVGAVVNLLLNIILLKNLGSRGAAITTVIAELTVTLTQIYLIKNLLNIKDMIKSIIILFPAAIVMLILVRITGTFMGAGMITTLVQICVGGLIYVAILFISFKLIYKENIVSYIKNIVKN